MEGWRVVDWLLVVTKVLLVFMTYVSRVVIGKVSRAKDCMLVVVHGLHVVLVVPAVVKLGMIADVLRVVVHSSMQILVSLVMPYDREFIMRDLVVGIMMSVIVIIVVMVVMMSGYLVMGVIMCIIMMVVMMGGDLVLMVVMCIAVMVVTMSRGLVVGVIMSVIVVVVVVDGDLVVLVFVVDGCVINGLMMVDTLRLVMVDNLTVNWLFVSVFMLVDAIVVDWCRIDFVVVVPVVGGLKVLHVVLAIAVGGVGRLEVMSWFQFMMDVWVVSWL